MSLAATAALPYPRPQHPPAMCHLVAPDFLLSQAKSCHFFVTLLLFIRSDNILELFTCWTSCQMPHAHRLV